MLLLVKANSACGKSPAPWAYHCRRSLEHQVKVVLGLLAANVDQRNATTARLVKVYILKLGT